MAPPPFTIGELEAIGLAWARVAPTVTLVPAFGLRALPASARAVVGLGLAAVIAPAVVAASPAGAAAASASVPWVIRALGEIVLGIPVALAAAIPLWSATMAGGLVDGLRGSADGQGLAVVEDRPSSFGVLLSLLASTLFLSSGGPARVAGALARAPVDVSSSGVGGVFRAAAQDLVAGIGVALAVGAPLLAAAVVLELAFALVARASSPAQVHSLLAPLRAIGLLAIAAVVLDRLAAFLAIGVVSAGG